MGRFIKYLTEAHMDYTTDQAKTIGDEIGVDWSQVDLEEFRMGLGVEFEHRNTVDFNLKKMALVALDHLAEDPKYYTKLKEVEATAPKTPPEDGEDLIKEAKRTSGDRELDDLISKYRGVAIVYPRKKIVKIDGRSKPYNYTDAKKYIKDSLKENILSEKAPPSKEIETWIKKNKQRFIDRYGEEEGTSILYGKAWNMYNDKNEGVYKPNPKTKTVTREENPKAVYQKHSSLTTKQEKILRDAMKQSKTVEVEYYKTSLGEYISDIKIK